MVCPSHQQHCILRPINRKSTSLALNTRSLLADSLSKAVVYLCTVLETSSEPAPQEFRDAFAFHLYMLYSFLFFLEQNQQKQSTEDRITAVNAMVTATKAMADYRSILWQRGVPDETVTLLPCRIAYPMLEKATTVVARKAAAPAISMLRITLEDNSVLATVSAALMDLMFSFEHMASIVVELCANHDALTTDLLREIGHFDGTAAQGCLGMKNVAPFLTELAQERPAVVLQHLTQLQGLLQLTEPYQMRSAVVTCMAHCAIHQPTARETLLDALSTRVYDVSSYTRSAVLKSWILVVQSRVLSKQRWVPSARLAVDRIQDKTATVRRQALILLMELLQHHPFPGLDPQPYQETLGTLYEFVMNHLPEDIAQFMEDDASRAAALAAAMERVAEDPDSVSEEFSQKVQALQFTQAALEFIEVFENAKDQLYGLLLSASATDVAETLRFVVQAYHMKLPVTNLLQRALALLWSADTRTPALQTFVDVFVNNAAGEQLPPEAIARNLIQLARQSSDSEMASMEEAIIRLVTEERLPDDVFLILWSMVSQNKCRATALHLLSMGAGADRSIVDSKSRLMLLLECGFAEPKNCSVLRASCLCLQRIGRAQPDPSDAKYLVLETLMEELCEVCRGEQSSETAEWFSVSEHAIKALFVVCPEPEVSCKRVLVRMSDKTFRNDQAHPLQLAKFFHVLGNIVLNLLVYTEALHNSVRRGNSKRSLKNQEDHDDMEDELGVAAAEEAETERRMTDIAENEIVGRNLVSLYAPLLVRVVGGEITTNETLMQAATLALCKCMCVSNDFCEKHLPLVFKSLSPAQDTTMRANTVVALGDLAFRFPNAVEPYTPHLYACLRDASTKVRRHTLMVLTHLILNDMIKVKGQVSEIALCLRDDDGRISDMSRLLFCELSKRSNSPIYNWLPEIISQIIDQDVSKEDFRSIMSFLFAFIRKEKQNEMLTEKLCQRFSKCSTSNQAADMVFCLSLLKMNEKSLKCLSDNFGAYKEFLFDEEIKKSFAALITKARKGTSKPELRQIIDEWEGKLSELVEASQENFEATAAASRAKRKARNRRKKLVALVEEEEELDFTEKENDPGITA